MRGSSLVLSTPIVLCDREFCVTGCWKCRSSLHAPKHVATCFKNPHCMPRWKNLCSFLDSKNIYSLGLTHESPVYSRGVVVGRSCHHEYMSTTYGGLWVRGYSVLPSHPAFFARFYQGYLGFARSSRVFVLFCLGTIFDGKKNVTKRVFCYKKCHCFDKVDVF